MVLTILIFSEGFDSDNKSGKANKPTDGATIFAYFGKGGKF